MLIHSWRQQHSNSNSWEAWWLKMLWIICTLIAMQAWAASTRCHKCINFQQIGVAWTKWTHLRNSQVQFRVTTHFHLLHSVNFKIISKNNNCCSSNKTSSSNWRHTQIIKLFWWRWIIWIATTNSNSNSSSSFSRCLWVQPLHWSLIECSKSNRRSFSTWTPFSSSARIQMMASRFSMRLYEKVWKTLIPSLSTHLSSTQARVGSSPNVHKRV